MRSRVASSMRAAVCLLAFVLAIALPSLAQTASLITVSGSNLESGGVKITNATISWQAVSNADVSLPGFHIGGSSPGQHVGAAVTGQVTTGAFSVSVPDTYQTNPQNVCYDVQVVDNVTGNQWLHYSCVQPASSGQTSWCTTTSGVTTCNFDNYSPAMPALALQTQGPVGPAGPQGPAGPSGSGFTRVLPSAGTVNVVGLGDSIVGYSDTDPRTYTAILETLPALTGRVGTTTICSYGGQTIATVASNYTSCVHPHAPSVTGVPALLTLEAGANDLTQGTSLSGMESGMTSLVAEAKTDGFIVGVSTVMNRSSITFRPTDYLVRAPFNNWLKGQYQAGNFDYLFDWDNLVTNPFDAQVLNNTGGEFVHPTIQTRYLMAQQMNSALLGDLNPKSAASLPIPNLYNVPFWNVYAESQQTGSADGWTILGEWKVNASNGLAPLVLTLTGNGGSYSYGFLILNTLAGYPVSGNPVNGVQGTFYYIANTDNSAVSPDVETIKMVETPGTLVPGNDWEIYAQLHTAFGGLNVAALTSPSAGTWIPLMTTGATSPGADSSTVKSATLTNLIPGSSFWTTDGSGNPQLLAPTNNIKMQAGNSGNPRTVSIFTGGATGLTVDTSGNILGPAFIPAHVAGGISSDSSGDMTIQPQFGTLTLQAGSSGNARTLNIFDATGTGMTMDGAGNLTVNASTSFKVSSLLPTGVSGGLTPDGSGGWSFKANFGNVLVQAGSSGNPRTLHLYDSSGGGFALDGSGNGSVGGNFNIGGGSTTVYRCTTAGTLPVGALTTATANCGASTDTGLRTK